MNKKFTQIRDNEWFQPTMKNHKMACCDCGLIHDVSFRIVGNSVQMKAKRLKRKLKSKDLK